MRDPLSAAPPTGPDPASWVTAGLRSLHPARWGLGLGGIAATALVIALAQAFFDGQVPRLADWFHDPVPQAMALGDHLAGRSFTGLVVRLAVLAAIVTGLWGLIGAWIARHEMLTRFRSRPDASTEPVEPGPTRLVVRKPKDLVLGFVMVLVLCGVLLLPVTLGGALNHLGGVGALLVAVLLPVILVADLILLCLLVGLLAWPLMPITIAVENSDLFDGLSRAYNYAFMRPVRFVLLMATAIGLAAAPTAAVLWLLAGPVAEWPKAAGHPAVWAATGLSASLFWSLQTLVYLDLRTAVDAVAADEIAGEPEPVAPTPEGGGQPAPPPGAKVAARFSPLTHVVILVLMVATWFLTAWLFARLGGENAGWLGWGVGEHFRPPAEGWYWYASLMAGAWGAIWVAAPILVAVRQMLRSDPRDFATKSSEGAGGQLDDR